MRLPTNVVPTRYVLDLTLRPEEETFPGTIDIDLAVAEPTAVIWLNGISLTVRDASLTAGGRTEPVRSWVATDDLLGFAPARPVGPGPARLHITYEGPISGKDDVGLFHENVGEDRYVYSQFEWFFARRAFPCFDEPADKVPWQLTLHVRKEHVAVSNTPILSEREEAGGMKAVAFAETKPLPSYLVALAVGPFELLDAGAAGRNRVPLRIVVPRGLAGQAGYAVTNFGPVMTHLEDYFDIPYPYPKCDLVAVPRMGGAMENAGMITSTQAGILRRPEEENIGFRRGFVNLIVHEGGHQWFGDLVTMKWWDDLWLNEAFATWIEYRIVDEWKPEWHVLHWLLGQRGGAMSQDSLVSARRIRQPVESNNDIENAFDAITYGKGGSVLFMVESWLGRETFRRGMQRHLRAHAHGTATSADFVSAMSEAAGRDLRPLFASFLDQGGLPLITARLACGEGDPHVELSQRRFLPLGSTGSETQTWQVPVCVGWGDGKGEKGHDCLLLTEAAGVLSLPGGSACPTWINANRGGAGYYRTVYTDGPALLSPRNVHRLSRLDRLTALDDLAELFSAGRMPARDALALLPELAGDEDPEVFGRALGLAWSFDGLRVVTPELRPNYARFIRKSFGGRARKLGWKPRKREDDETRLLRPSLLALVAGNGEEPGLAAEAGELGRKWLDDRRAVDPDVLWGVMRVAAHRGDRKLFDRVHETLRRTTDATDRSRLEGMLAGFTDPSLFHEAIGLTLSDEIDPREAGTLLFGGLGDWRTREAVYDFLSDNFDALVARLPDDFQSALVAIAPFCDPQHRAEVEARFKDRAARVTGGPRALQQSLESMDLCIATRAAHEADLTAFLKAQ